MQAEESSAAVGRQGDEAPVRDVLLDTLLQPIFDSIAAAASSICAVPIALVSILERERQSFKANVGLPGVSGTAREVAFCDHAVRGEQIFEIEDALRDARFASNPLVTSAPGIRFYAGAPIALASGERIGTVCVIDRKPGQLSPAQRAILGSLSRIASACVEVTTRHAAMTRAVAVREERYRSIVEDQTELISLAQPDGTLTYVNPAYARHFGCQPDEMVGRPLIEYVDPADRAAVLSHWATVCGGPGAVSGLNRMSSAQGQTRWVAWTNRPLRDAAQQLLAVQSVGRDITDQKIAEDALKESEQRLRSLYEATPAVMHSIDDRGRLLSVSDLWLRKLGYERAEVLGRPSANFLAPESARRARESVLPEFFRSGRCDQVEYQFVRKDGSLVEMLLSARLERDEHGTPLRSLAVLEDVTEGKRIAAELARTHASLDAIVENVPALLGQWDADGTTRFANREFQAAVGLPLEQIVGQPLRAIYDAIDPMAYDQLEPHIAQVLQGRQQEFELAMLTTSGLRQLRLTLVPDRQAGGAVVGYYAMAHDITGHKALELRLTDSEHRYRSLFENLNSGFALHEIVVDTLGKPVDYKFLAVNEAFSSMTGFTSEQVMGRRVTEVAPGIATEAIDWIAILGHVALSGEPKHFEQRSATLDRWFSVVAYRPAAGQFAVIAQDITSRKLAEERLQGALQEKETLLKEVYHRVKNNLQVVQSLLNLQYRSLPAGAARSALEDSVQRVRAMALVHEKLYQSGNLAAVSLPEYLQDLLRQIGEATGANQRQIRISADIAPIRIGLDSAIPFGLLVTELVSNALKHAFPNGSGGAVAVGLVTAADASLLLTVADDGIGLPPAFALAAVRSMGLQLAANLARQLGGDLSAGNRQGASFSVRLPKLPLP